MLYIDFYSVLQHVSAVYYSHYQAGILTHKHSKRGQTSPYVQSV